MIESLPLFLELSLNGILMSHTFISDDSQVKEANALKKENKIQKCKSLNNLKYS